MITTATGRCQRNRSPLQSLRGNTSNGEHRGAGVGVDVVATHHDAAACHVHVDILIKPGDDVPAVLAHHLGMQERACIRAAQPDDAGVRSFTGMPQFLRSRAGDGRQRV